MDNIKFDLKKILFKTVVPEVNKEMIFHFNIRGSPLEEVSIKIIFLNWYILMGFFKWEILWRLSSK